ncbi:pentapeptide repeat-containing protein [Collimonas sp.]|jgi:uncharacterized protein YjbI with pentapeptide repeats|uniref:pentapeptide repeat-containing protein n=1 Tax=Collimonas sp. TaxID=1963772 RepID=UPI002BD155A1|nr:pentapeptide repeat-containing protein [Collimonas sp.]HWW05879.1 pentapeptide repeat-containing protein [Collimonas sp.]
MLRPRKHLRRNRLTSTPPKSRAATLADKFEKNPLLRIWVRINQSLALFALAVAAVGFAVAVKKFNVDERKTDEDRVAKAWDVVSRMSGKQSNGGQVSALERLNSFGISLDFVDIHNTFAAGVNLSHAKLHKANFSGANLEGVDLSGSNLDEADLSDANLVGANLSGAHMYQAKFRNAKLAFARIDLAIVMASDLRDADLTGAVIVFDDSEDGEVWAAFSDSLADVRDLKDIQALFNTACANPRFAPVMYSRLELKPPRRRCASELDYIQYLRKYSRKDWGVSTDELFNFRLPKPVANSSVSR